MMAAVLVGGLLVLGGAAPAPAGAAGEARLAGLGLRLVDDLRQGPLVDDPGLGPLAATGGRFLVQPRRASPAGLDPGVLALAACAGGFLFPGLGHTASGTYLYRGLAFSTAVGLAVLSAVALFARSEAVPGLRDPLEDAAILMVVTAEILYLWSILDAVLLALRTSPDDIGVPLGAFP